MVGPIFLATMFILIWFGSLFGNSDQPEKAKKTAEEELGEAIARLLKEMRETEPNR
jgi:Fe2+ transport system protein B